MDLTTLDIVTENTEFSAHENRTDKLIPLRCSNSEAPFNGEIDIVTEIIRFWLHKFNVDLDILI